MTQLEFSPKLKNPGLPTVAVSRRPGRRFMEGQLLRVDFSPQYFQDIWKMSSSSECVFFFVFLFPFRRGISLDPKHWKLGLKVLWGAMAMKCTLSHFFVLNESVALPKPKSPWSSNQVKFEIPSPLRKGYITSTLASRRKKKREPLEIRCFQAAVKLSGHMAKLSAW